ncbi:MAG: hypothetical protein EXR78_05400 [Deltaproteobacteria bacterium]|nr:hypothetical protein [Deltaproteobacteria bacterium]
MPPLVTTSPLAQSLGLHTRRAATLRVSLRALLLVLLLATQATAAVLPPILFVTQPPFGSDFVTVNAVFGNHDPGTDLTPRGGDLYIRYSDGVLRNLTREARFGLTAGREIAVREPSVHWSGTKALFSMVIGGTTKNDYSPVYWQMYEITGIGKGQVVQVRKLPQPTDTNNVSPFYGTDDRILFTSDRPRNGSRLTYPQLDEYESAPIVTGIWSMKPDGTGLRLLDHTPSGAFTPIIASDGRIIYTRWDHLQRDQQNNEGTLSYGAFNFASEASTLKLTTNTEIFPELRTQPSGSYYHGHRMNFFFPWQLNEDGSGLETLNHIGRHELSGYFDSSHNGLPEFIAPTGRRTTDLFLQIKESPTRPGYFFGIKAPEFATHAAGQLIGLNGLATVNADAMQVQYLGNPQSATYIQDGVTPPANYPGHFRSPTPLSNGLLIAVRATSPYQDRRTGGPLSSRYNFHLVQMIPGSPYWTPTAPILPTGIAKTISYWDNSSYQQLSYTGRLWELDPVEVRVRTRPARHTTPVPAIETQILEQELSGPTGVQQLRTFLATRKLALVVSRNVTRRADRQQDFNLKITGSSTQTALPGTIPVEISHLQFFQGDLLRGYNNFSSGRRVLGQVMHNGLLPPLLAGPKGSVKLGPDGSMAAFVPAERALSWQLTTPTGTPIIRERYWVTFARGEIRVCANCHGVNTKDVVLSQPEPTNPPQALRTLLRWYRATYAP